MADPRQFLRPTTAAQPFPEVGSGYAGLAGTLQLRHAVKLFPERPIHKANSGSQLIRWFYLLPENDNVCASPEKIYQDYPGAVKHGNIFSLDVGPDRAGRLHAIDVRTLQTVGRLIRGEISLPVPPVKHGPK